MKYQGKPWERQRGDDGELEPMMWFSRFQTYYLSLGPDRSLLGAYKDWRLQKARKHNKSLDRSSITAPSSSWLDNSRAWEWIERAEAWDQEQLRRAADRQKEEVQRMFDRHVDLGMCMQVAATKRLQRLASDEDDWMQMSPDQARLLAKDGSALERQARGLPAWLIQIATMTDTELIERWHSMFGEEPPSYLTGDDEEPKESEGLDLDKLLGPEPEDGGGLQAGGEGEGLRASGPEPEED